MEKTDKIEKKFDALQKRYNSVVQEGMDKLDSEYLCLLHSNYFNCGLNCTKNNFTSAKDLQNCIQKCEEPVSKIQSGIQQELNFVQNRLQQCASECALKSRDSVSRVPSDQEREIAETSMIKCATKCVDDQISEVLPSLFSRLRKDMQETINQQQKLL